MSVALNGQTNIIPQEANVTLEYDGMPDGSYISLVWVGLAADPCATGAIAGASSKPLALC